MMQPQKENPRAVGAAGGLPEDTSKQPKHNTIGTARQRRLLLTILRRGDTASLEAGCLLIRPASGKPIPPEWLAEHEGPLIEAILAACGRRGFRYQSYSTGRFSGGRFSGVSLRFVNLLTGEEFYALFNAELDRERTTKGGRKGDPLPPGQFRVGDRNALWRLWQASGLPWPRRPSELCEVMHRLSRIVVEADQHDKKPGRLVSTTFRPLSIGPDAIKDAFGIDRQVVGRLSATNRQLIGNRSATVVGKEASQSLVPPATEPDLSRVCFEPRKKQEVNKEAREQESLSFPSVDEWLTDFNRRDAEILAAENRHPDYDVRMAGYLDEARRLLTQQAQ